MDKYEYNGNTIVEVGDLVELEALHQVKDIRQCPVNPDAIEVLIGDPEGDHGGIWLQIEECRIHKADGSGDVGGILPGEVEAKIRFDDVETIYLYGLRQETIALVIPMFLAAVADPEAPYNVEINDENGALGVEQVLDELDGMPLPPGMADSVLERAEELRKVFGRKDVPEG